MLTLTLENIPHNLYYSVTTSDFARIHSRGCGRSLSSPNIQHLARSRTEWLKGRRRNNLLRTVVIYSMHRKVRLCQKLQLKPVLRDRKDARSGRRKTTICHNLNRTLTMVYSPYTQAPVKVYIGTDKILHFLPKHLVPHSWVQNAELYFPSLDAEIGHTLVHFIFTGMYATLYIHAESPVVHLRRALRVYIAARSYVLPELQQLALRDIKRHAEKMDLSDIIEAIRDDFKETPLESDFHAYLITKMIVVFNSDRTVFMSERFFESSIGTSLTKFVMQKAIALFQEERFETAAGEC
jgi:hypothetical protein